MNKIKGTLIKQISTSKITSVPRKFLSKVILAAIAIKNGVVIYHTDPEEVKIFNLIRQIKNETQMLLNDLEAFHIYNAVKNIEKIEGDIAEVGTFRGGSAKIICETTKKQIHLFDTFEGLPELHKNDNPEQFHKNQFSASYNEVRNYLKNYSNVHFYKGLFPSTSKPVADKRFSFVHLDVDLYEPTLQCLDFFYPRLNNGGVIISHDYNGAPGVKMAFEEYFKGKPDFIMALPGSTQCLAVKVS